MSSPVVNALCTLYQIKMRTGIHIVSVSCVDSAGQIWEADLQVTVD